MWQHARLRNSLMSWRSKPKKPLEANVANEDFEKLHLIGDVFDVGDGAGAEGGGLPVWKQTVKQ